MKILHVVRHPEQFEPSASPFAKGGREGDLADCKDSSCRKSPQPPLSKGGLMSPLPLGEGWDEGRT